MTSTERIVVVTGGMSGIGAACAALFAERGDLVVVLDRAGQDVETVAGARRHYRGCDVSDPEAVAAVAADIEGRIGPVSVLVNNAGIIQKPVPPEHLPLAEWDAIMSVDLRGAYLVATHFAAPMLTRGHGAIVNMASIVGMRSTPLHAYAPAKAAVIAMTQCLATEWGASGLRVNAVSPGYTATPALEASIARGERDPSLLERDTALGRLVKPEEIAKVVHFLASDDAAAITGVNLPVDAGWLVATPWRSYGGVRPPRNASPIGRDAHSPPVSPLNGLSQ